MSQGQRVRSPSLQSMLGMLTNALCTNDAYFHVLIDDIGEGGDGDTQTNESGSSAGGPSSSVSMLGKLASGLLGVAMR